MRRPAVLVLVLSVFPWPLPTHAASRTVDLSGLAGVVDLSSYIDVLRDPRGEWTVGQVGRAPLADRFAPAASYTVQPRGDTAVWVRVRYLQRRDTDDVRLSLCHPGVESVQVFVRRGEGWREQPLSGRRSGTLGDSTLVSLPARDKGTVLLRIASQWPVHLRLEACTFDACRARDARYNLWYGLFYGVMLVMGLFSVGLFVALRDRNHLLYVGFLAATVLYFLAENGLLNALVPHIGMAGLFNVSGAAIGLMVVFSGAFARSFLETRRIAPLADRLALTYIVLGAAFIPAMVLVPWTQLWWYANFLGLSAPVVIFGAGVVAWRRGFRPARFYLLAWTAVGVGAFVLALPRHALWQVQFYQVCAAVNALLLNLALVDRLRALRREREAALEAARERERLVRAVFDQTFQFIGLTEPGGKVLDVNRSALQFIGAEAADVVGRPFWETRFWPQSPEEAEQLRTAFRRAAAGEFVRVETRVERPDGGPPLWLDFSLKPILDETGRVSLLIPEGRDISGRVRSEQRLRHTRDQLEATLSALPDLFFEVDREGRIHDFRAPQPDLLALPPATFLGQRVEELMPPAVSRAIMQALAGAERSPARACVGAVYSLETPRGPGWFEPSVAVKGEPCGDKTRFVVLVRDVTERKRVEQELRRRENMLRTLTDLGHRLFTSQRLEETIRATLGELGPAAEVSRIALYANGEVEGQRLRGERRFEWNGPAAERCTAAPPGISYAEAGVTRWVALMERGEPIVGNVADLPEGERAVLERLGVRSIAAVPIFVAHRWWGFLVFEECNREREWSDAEVMVLRSAAGLIGVSIERDEAEDALRESEAKYRAIFENAQVALFRIDVKDGRVIEANSVMAQIYGYATREEYIARYSMATGWVDPADRQRMFDLFRANNGVLDRFEARFKRKDGSTFWARFSARIISDKGYMEGVGQDITEEKRWVQELAESESRYRTIFETTGHAMVIFDDTGRIQLANREFETLTGYNGQERELTWMDMFSGESLQQMKRYHEQRSEDPDSVPRSYEATLIDRRGREHEGIVVVDMIPGTSQRVAGFVDLTERKRAEREMLRADKMAALGQIIAGVAHEINNPNNFIHFNLPILKRYIDAMRPMLDHHLAEDPELKVLNMPYPLFLEDVTKLVENMQHGSARITAIVSELKNYIRGQEAEERRPERLETVFEHVMVLVGKQVQKVVRRFEVKTAPNLPPVSIDAGKIEQVLINLIINAGQAADKPDAWVRLEARPAPGDPGWVEIVVEDNGTGIPADTIQHIFDPFFTTKGRDAGTGLGLSISHRIVEEHGGTITVQSTAGQGSRFAIRLPACENTV